MSLLSIVHEFAVLYSSRLVQKDKKWSDGRLRYYELNNKLEVLSDDMLLVVTDFYPHHARKPLECAVFAEGNDYILPSGKLILEFNEYLGRSERDLTNVFTRKNVAVKKELDTLIAPECTALRVKHERDGHLLPKEVSPIKQEFPEANLSKNLSSPQMKPLVGRPIGLRRSAKSAEKPSKSRQLMKVDVGERLDASFLSITRTHRRIPPGSNKLSRRLKFETGLFLARSENIMNEDFV